MKFYKIRALILSYLTRFFGRILCVEVPPIISAAGIVEKDGKILLLDHTYLKGYGFPGGMVNAGESLADAVLRKVTEETGLEVIGLEYFTSTASSFQKIPTLNVSFIVHVSGTEVESSEGKLIWMPPHDVVGKMAYKGSEITLQKYIERRLK